MRFGAFLNLEMFSKSFLTEKKAEKNLAWAGFEPRSTGWESSVLTARLPRQKWMGDHRVQLADSSATAEKS